MNKTTNKINITNCNLYKYQKTTNCISFSGSGVQNTIKETISNPITQRHLSNYIKRGYLQDYTREANDLIETINNVSNLNDENAFKIIEQKYKSFGPLPNVKTRISEFEAQRTEIVHDTISDILNKNRITPTSIIDLGCGDGSILKEIQKDYNIPKHKAAGLEIFNQNSFVPFSAIKYDGINVKSALNQNAIYNGVNQHFDTAVLASVLHHSDNHGKIINNLNDVLDKNGYLLIEDIGGKEEFKNFHTVIDKLLNIFRNTPKAPIPANYVTMESLESLLKSNGFEVVDSITYNPFQLRQFVTLFKKIK